MANATTSWKPGYNPRAGHPTQPSHLRAPAIRRLRAMRLVEGRVYGLSYKQLAKEFNISETTVGIELTYAARQGLIEAAEQRIVGELVPLALNRYQKTLLDPESGLGAAKDVLGMLSAITDRASNSKQHAEKLTLAAYLEMKRLETSAPSSKDPYIDAESTPVGADEDVPDGSVQELPDAAPEDAPDPRPAVDEAPPSRRPGFLPAAEYLTRGGQ